MPQKKKKATYLEIWRVVCVLAVITLFTSSLDAQGPELQQQHAEVEQKLAPIEQAMFKDKQALLHYTWIEQDTISVKGEVKWQEHFKVRMRPDGSHQKTSLDPQGSAIAGDKNEYQNYADQIRALIQQYLPPDQELLERAYRNDYIKAGPEERGHYQLVISNYVKRGDKVTLVFDRVQKSLVSLTIGSYLNSPSDAVNMDVRFSKIQGGPNHVSTETINGASKGLTVVVQNSNYKEL